ncbi:hypothetical protein G6O69_08010 [Pseudenhygromyxa sp. WMMC2535]|uniref:hypothetical protein n=1 Tax=Pseudenhygromyxa sp. WMMC2535 TaxID=2712867 RepID=UPI001552E237|nr:hypothetical protein [Pseudenhygromyxa sp. WMMC2535]NVB37774.1 hypothetical protein [Pseudenhygromyxa sp. WMMC2535]
MQAPVLALADELPNYEAIGLSPGVGWMFFAAVLCLVGFFVAHHESWRKFWLRLDDPRPMAAMRIVFGFCALCNVNGLWELFDYLFMDEGIFSTDVAQHFRARSQFVGFGDGQGDMEPWGFFSFGAFLEWLEGPNWSLLLIDSSPKFFWTYLVVFEVVMVAFIVGFQTKWIKWVAWFLYMGLILRNTLFWEATENVYRVFFFYLVLSRCGEAWSVDNWLRCRRLRKQGRLSEPGKPETGEGRGLVVEEGGVTKVFEPIFRAIPAWPRMLVILNVATLYCATGTLKNGPVWARGDSFYYSFNLDHFYRLPPQKLAAIFGTTFFRLNTWIVHWWEALFPLVVFGLIVRWHRREGIAKLEGWRLWTARLGLGGFVAWFYAIILYSYPVHYKVPKEGFSLFGVYTFAPEDSLRAVQWIVGLALPVAATAIVLGYRWLRRRSDLPRAQRGRLAWLDLDWVCRWPFGRRVWLVLGLIFHGHLILMMNIGWFSPGLLACYFAFLNGEELGYLATKIGQGLNRFLRIPMPAHVIAGEPRPTADRRLPAIGRKGQPRIQIGKDLVQPLSVVFTAVALMVVGVLVRVWTDENMWEDLGRLAERGGVELPAALLAQVPEINTNWFVAMVLVLGLVVMAQRMRGFCFNPWFGPVIVLAAGLTSMLAARETLDMAVAVAAVAVLATLGSRVKPSPAADDAERARAQAMRPGEGERWAYAPLGRTLLTVFLIYHMAAVIYTQIPEKDSWSTFRKPMSSVVGDYLRTTQTTQGWGMFAPNPPRRNVFLRVMVVDTDDEIYDLNTDVYACFAPGATEDICDAIYPLPWIWYTRQRKMNRRIAGSEGGNGSWYQKWHARYVCRRWELDRGHLPKRVELYRVTYPIRSPEKAFGNPYDPKEQYNRFGSHKKIYTTECAKSPLGQMSNEVRARHGLEPRPEKEIKRWNKHRCRGWEEKLIEDARARGEEVDVLDPEFDVCPDMPPEVRKAQQALEREAEAEAD